MTASTSETTVKDTLTGDQNAVVDKLLNTMHNKGLTVSDQNPLNAAETLGEKGLALAHEASKAIHVPTLAASESPPAKEENWAQKIKPGIIHSINEQTPSSDKPVSLSDISGKLQNSGVARDDERIPVAAKERNDDIRLETAADRKDRPELLKLLDSEIAMATKPSELKIVEQAIDDERSGATTEEILRDVQTLAAKEMLVASIPGGAMPIDVPVTSGIEGHSKKDIDDGIG